LHEKHWVFSQKWPQPGQQPAVQNVFQRVPQPEPGSPGAQYQRLSAFGSHEQSGQWICGWADIGFPEVLSTP
jgi:hypothetical protein